MKKIYILAAVLALSGCANSKNDTRNVVTLLSYEKYTDLYINNELQGINHTQAKLPYKGIKNATLRGEKKGCKTAVLSPDYEFDTPMLLNPFNLLYVPEKYFAWDWWRPSNKDVYNLTQNCDR